MIFKQKGNEMIWDGQKVVPFTDGIIKTDDPAFINVLERAGYEGEEDGETIQGDTEGQEAEKEPTFNELRQEAKAREIEGYSKMNKAELIEALKEGE